MNYCRTKLAAAVSLAVASFIAIPLADTSAETCLSPYIKGLKQPEKVMYLWSLPAVAGAGEPTSSRSSM